MSANTTVITALIVAVVTAAATAGINFLVDAEQRESVNSAERKDQARAVASVLMAGLDLADDGVSRMVSSKQALVYRTDVALSPADKRALAFEVSPQELRSVIDAVLKVQQLWPAGAHQAKLRATRSEQWQEDKSLQKRAARSLTLIREGEKALADLGV